MIENRQSASPDWFLDWAYEEVQRLMDGKGQYTLTARTTVDLDMQRHADDDADRRGPRRRAASIASTPAPSSSLETDGMVRALVGGPDYGESQFNRATHAKRQPGSSFKVYVYAAALENGYRPDQMVGDYSRTCGNWHPQNYDGSHGSGQRMPLWSALAKSLNTVAAELSFAVGREKVIELTQRVGIKRHPPHLLDGARRLRHQPARAHRRRRHLRQRRQERASPTRILDVTNSKGELVYSRERDEPEPAQIVSRRVAEQMNQMMQKVVTEGTGKSAALEFTHVAGKTGTSTGPKDIWFVGFTGKLRRHRLVRQRRQPPDAERHDRRRHGRPRLALAHDGGARHQPHSDAARPHAASLPGRRAGPPRRAGQTRARHRTGSSRRRPETAQHHAGRDAGGAAPAGTGHAQGGRTAGRRRARCAAGTSGHACRPAVARPARRMPQSSNATDQQRARP